MSGAARVKIKLTVTVLLVMVLGVGCSERLVTASNEGTVLPSELTAHPERYDGKHVDVRGYIVLGPESRNIFDSEDGTRDPHGACLGLDGPEVMFGSFHKQFTQKISGVFRRSLCGKNDVCLYWCSSSGIELDKGSKP
jgi:hypothetical protein